MVSSIAGYQPFEVIFFIFQINTERVAVQIFRINFESSSMPSKHGALTQCCFNVGPSSSTSAQHYNNIGSTTRVCRADVGSTLIHPSYSQWEAVGISSHHDLYL